MLKKSIWRVHDSCDQGIFLFVDPDTSIISIVFPESFGERIRFGGFGLWYHEISNNELATCIIAKSREVKWLHELYRDYDTWLQWHTRDVTIQHDRVSLKEVPKELIEVHQNRMKKYISISLPEYDFRNRRF